MSGVGEWSLLLARRAAPQDEPFAVALGQLYAAGGSGRDRLLRGGGERTAGFGAGLGPADLAVILDSLRVASAVTARLLEQPWLANATASATLAVTIAQWRRGGAGRRRAPSAVAAGSSPGAGAGRVPSDVVCDLETAIRDLQAELVARGRKDKEATETAAAVLGAMIEHPRSAAAFLGALRDSDHDSPRTSGRWSRPGSGQRASQRPDRPDSPGRGSGGPRSSDPRHRTQG